MNTKLEKIYLKCPVFLQNAGISLIGLKENLIRYSGIYENYSKAIKNNQKTTKEEIEKLQERMLKSVIYNAAVSVPYYKEIFAKDRLPPIDKFNISDIRSMPFLTKKQIKENQDAFVTRGYNVKKLITIHTTGTTGTPLKIFCTPEVRQKNYAFFSRFLHSVGINPMGSRATIGGRVVLGSDQSDPPFWRYSFFQKSLFMSSYHLNDRNIESYIEVLKKMKPSYIDAYPSSINIIAEYAYRKNRSLKGITKGIVTSAETLYPHQRTMIENVFGIPVYDQYGAAEMCVFIAQCKAGKYHLHSDYSYVEFLRDDGCSAGPGEEADIVCTGFINDVMPLIRYRIGDRAVLSKNGCECGSSFPVIQRILGRADEVILTPDGKKIGRLSPVLKGFPIREAQYRQYILNEIELLIVKDTDYNGETDTKIIEEVRKRTGSLMSVTIRHVQNIEREKGGKMRSVISYVKDKPEIKISGEM